MRFLVPVPYRFPASVTSKGQVTIPADVRKHLGLAKTDKVYFIVEPDGGVRIEKSPYPTIESLAGAAANYKLKHPKPWKQIREEAWEDHVKEVLKDG